MKTIVNLRPTRPPVDSVMLELSEIEFRDLQKMVACYRMEDAHREHIGTSDFTHVQREFRKVTL